jgi:hypothetical protein
MNKSESIIKITPAFLSAQKKIVSVIKDSSNPYYMSKYADLTAVIDACKDKLNAEGIAILQPIDGMSVETILVHESGEWFSSSTPIVSKDEKDPQKLGSAITYAKRYGLQSMILLPAEDDDGHDASQPSKSNAVAKTTTKSGLLKDCQEVGCSIKGLSDEVVEDSNKLFGKTYCFKCRTKYQKGQIV